jgi:hypothetical protein
MEKNMILSMPEGYFKGRDGKYYQRIEHGSFKMVVEVKKEDIPETGIPKSFQRNRKADYNERVWRVDYKGEKRELFVSQNLKDVLDDAKERNRNNFHFLGLISGTSGSGKSTLGFSSIAMYLDPKFTQENIVFCAKDLIKRATQVDDFSCLILDESQLDLSNRVTGSTEFLRLLNFLSQVRQRNLYILLIAPSFFDLSKTICLDMSSLLFYTYVGKGFKRGNYLLFDKGDKLQLWLHGKTSMNYGAVGATHKGTYSLNKDFIDEKEYLRRKREFLDNLETKIDEKKVDKYQRDKFIVKLRERGMTFTEISDIVGISDSVCGRIYRDFIKNDKKVTNSTQENPKIHQEPQ